MKRLLLFVVLSATSAGAQDVTSDSLTARASRIVKHMDAGRFDSATALFDANMREKLPAARLGETWTGLVAALGKPLEIGAASLSGEGPARTVTIPIRFGTMTIGAAFTFDASGRAKSLAMRPAS